MDVRHRTRRCTRNDCRVGVLREIGACRHGSHGVSLSFSFRRSPPTAEWRQSVDSMGFVCIGNTAHKYNSDSGICSCGIHAPNRLPEAERHEIHLQGSLPLARKLNPSMKRNPLRGLRFACPQQRQKIFQRVRNTFQKSRFRYIFPSSGLSYFAFVSGSLISCR